MVAVYRQSAEVRGAGAHQLDPPIGQVRRHLDTDSRQQPPGLRHKPLQILDRHLRRPLRRIALRPLPDARVPVLGGGGVRYLRRLAPVVALMGDEVLEDHLLDVPVALVQPGERLQRGHPIVLGLADPHQDPRRERDLQLAGCGYRLEPLVGVLARRTLVHDQVRVGRLEHQPLRGRDLLQPRQVRTGEDAEVGVREHAALERPLTRPDDVGGEVLVPVGLKERRNSIICLRTLPREYEQLFGPLPARGALQQLLHFVWLVKMGAMRGERAVLAVTAAGAR